LRSAQLKVASLVLLGLVSAGLWWQTNSTLRLAINLCGSYIFCWYAYFCFSRQPWQTLLGRFILAHVSVVLTVAALESGTLINFVDYRVLFATPILSPQQSPHFRKDRELLHLHHAHARLQGKSVGDFAFLFDVPSPTLYSFDVRFDGNGFRNTRDYQQAEICVLGDSFVEGAFVSEKELVTSQLADLRGTTVANLGQIGYGPQQQLIVLRRFALGLKPRAVVWMFFEGNDLKNIHFYNKTTAEWDTALSSFHRFLDRSFSRNAFLAFARVVGNPRPSGAPRSGLFKAQNGQTLRLYFLYPMHPCTAQDEAALQETGKIIAEALRECAAGQIALLVVFVPTKFRVYADRLEIKPHHAIATWRRNDMPRRFRDVVLLHAPQAGFLDLTPLMAEAAMRGEVLYHTEDSHWNAAGNRLAATAIHDWLAGHATKQSNRKAGIRALASDGLSGDRPAPRN
jgi:hypothetical protein